MNTGGNTTLLLVRDWRTQLEEALDNNKYGGGDSLAALICEALIALPDSPSRKTALDTALRVQQKHGPHGKLGESACKLAFDQIWEDITENREPDIRHRNLRLTWRREYGYVLLAYHAYMSVNPDGIRVVLGLLAWLKDNRTVIFEDAQVINGGRLDRTMLLATWAVVCQTVDHMPEYAESCRAEAEGDSTRLRETFSRLPGIAAGQLTVATDAAVHISRVLAENSPN